MEILNSSTIVLKYLGGWSTLVFLFAAIGIIMLLGGIIVSNNWYWDDSRWMIYAGGIFCIVVAIICYATNNPVEVTTYQVILDDSISYNEFVEKYEVIKQEGRIYTIYEKDKED